MLTASATASFTDLLVTPSDVAQFFLHGWTLSNYGDEHTTGTCLPRNGLPGVLLHLAGGNQPGSIKDIHVIFPNNCIRLQQDVGTTYVEDVEVDGNSSTGARPCVVGPFGSVVVDDSRWFGVTCEHPGAGNYALEINGNGVTNGVRGFRCFGCRFESTGTTGDTTPLVRIRDARAVDIYAAFCAYRGGGGSGYCFEISESLSGLTDHVRISADYQAGSAKIVTNMITGINVSQSWGSYTYLRTVPVEYFDGSTTPTPGIAGSQTLVGTGSRMTAGTAIASKTCQAQTPDVQVVGAPTTDNVMANIGAGLPAGWQTGIQLSAQLTATNTVRVYLCNPPARVSRPQQHW